MKKNQSVQGTPPEKDENRFKKIFLSILPVVLYCVLIFYLSSRPGGFAPLGFKAEDKIIHFFEFFILGWLLSRGFQFGRTDLISNKLVLLVILIGAFYGASDEFHQYLVPGRSAEVLDWLADAVGATAGALGYRRYHKARIGIV